MPGNNETNRNLLTLLGAAGLDAKDVHLTNAVLCLKPGRMDAEVERVVQENCRHWLSETTRHLQPQAMVALGGNAWRSLCSLYGMRPRPLAISVRRDPEMARDGRALFARFHC